MASGFRTEPQDVPDLNGLIGLGLCTRTYLLGNLVRKIPIYGNEAMSIEGVRREAQIYRHLGNHTSVIECLSNLDSHVDLVFAANGDLEEYISSQPDTPTEVLLKLVWQATEAVAYVHSKGVIHGDIAARRFLLDEQLNVKLSGFTYASLDGEKGLNITSYRHFLPRDNMAPNTIKSDLFALGCTFYEIMKGKKPYADVHEHDVLELYKQKLFPDVDGLCCGVVILDCWNCKFSSAAEILERIPMPANPVAITAKLAGGRIINAFWDYWKLWWGLMLGRPYHNQKWKEAEE